MYRETFFTPTINKEENENMEHLYKIYIVEKNRSVHELPIVVAKNEEEAKHEAGVYSHFLFTQLNNRLSDVTVIVQNLGSVKVEKQNKKDEDGN